MRVGGWNSSTAGHPCIGSMAFFAEMQEVVLVLFASAIIKTAADLLLEELCEGGGPAAGNLCMCMAFFAEMQVHRSTCFVSIVCI